MPSGPKKRKAAKRKRQMEKNINNHPQGNDESQNEKGSDGGEVSSPEHHDHDDNHHQNPFNEGTEEVKEAGPLTAQPIASDAKSTEEIRSDIQIDKVVGVKEDSVVLVEGDMKSEQSSESKDLSFEQIENAKESYYRNANGSSTSNDESVAEKNTKGHDYNSIEVSIECHEFVKPIDSSPSNMTLIAENAPVEETGNSAAESSVNSVKAVASLSEAEKDDNGSVLLEKSVVPSIGVTNLAMKLNEDHAYPLTDESARASNLEEPKPKGCDSKVLASFSANTFTKSSNSAKHIKDSETPEYSENQPLLASAPRTVRKTSWLSCCGLFEVLSGSNR
ncbi:hypothetical protein TanjilG_20391 [Lupinus angustifolius]|uniref:Uncharacterized protein n=1 Tax=Lupinus angustifolius TaxID=3871 RepID=A0A4P1RWF6_LUPAN|nr:PREDICTED: uncharacterized protein LOC109348528 [Lupinus angustifolius]OIW19266.1 hypothetical protein TanjilG_20391 [Lupinus angustifolius]